MLVLWLNQALEGELGTIKDMNYPMLIVQQDMQAPLLPIIRIPLESFDKISSQIIYKQLLKTLNFISAIKRVWQITLLLLSLINQLKTLVASLAL
jgi:hypothetical protein